MLPLVLLDVDGVINAVSRVPDPDIWPDWRSGSAVANGRSWPICWSPSVTARVRRWHQDGLAEVHWLTTWGHAANAGLHELLGLPALPVAGTFDGAGSSSELESSSLAGVTAAAPDALTGRWWKLDVVRRLHTGHAGRRLIWIDDELRGRPNPYAEWAEQAGIVVVGPEPVTGLTEADLARVEQAL